jgi:hypothetical protein
MHTQHIVREIGVDALARIVYCESVRKSMDETNGGIMIDLDRVLVAIPDEFTDELVNLTMKIKDVYAAAGNLQVTVLALHSTASGMPARSDARRTQRDQRKSTAARRSSGCLPRIGDVSSGAD